VNIHEEARTSIRARARWNQTSIMLTAGETYELVASGCWTDLVIPHGPGGDPSNSWYMRLFERWRRVPTADWFSLIGTINTDMETAFVIGGRCLHSPRRTGQLMCFANDVPGFYWNNFGEIHLRVTRVS